MTGIIKNFVNLRQCQYIAPVASKYIYNTYAKACGSLFNWSKFSNQSSSFGTQVPQEKTGAGTVETDKREFLAVYPDLVHELSNLETHSNISDAKKWFAKVLQYNAIGGKMNRGMAVFASLKEFIPSQELTPEVKKKAHILGWVVEVLQSHYLVADDIIDGSKTRRGKPCWYLNKDVGLGAVNDSLLLCAGAYKILSLHFKNEPYYVDMLDLFHDINLKTVLGQCLDMQACPQGERPNLNKFTMEHYDAIVRHKTSYYSFYLPVALAMYMAGIRETDFARVAEITDRELHRQARTILLEMGSFFQVQDDYLDCFGNPMITGKIGSDISEGKCTWLAVVALQRASSSQKKLMEENYGRGETECVERVRELYKELNLPATYRAYEESTSSLIKIHIQQISRGLNHKVFFKLLDKIHKRTS